VDVGIASLLRPCKNLPDVTDARVKLIWNATGLAAKKTPAFDEVDRVEHVQLWRQCRPRQPVEFDFVASLYGRATKTRSSAVAEIPRDASYH